MTEEKKFMDPLSAIRLVRRTRRKKFYLWFTFDASPMGKEETHAFPWRHHLHVSAEQMVNVLHEMEDTSRRRAENGREELLVSVRESDNCIFIG